MPSPDTLQTSERIVISIPEFCMRYGISRSFYYAMRGRGIGPRELRLSARRVVILESAAKEWERDFQRLNEKSVCAAPEL